MATSTITFTSEKLPRRTKLFYGVGDWGFSVTATIIDFFFLMFLTDVVHLDPARAAVAILIGRSWDWVNDPLIGYLSDRTRSRWGRRRPFLLFGFIPFALGFAMLWWIPPFTSQTALAAYYGVAYMVYDTLATFVYMPYFALTPDLTLDYDERTSLTSYRMFFSIVSGLVAFLVPAAIIGDFVPGHASRVAWMGLIFGATSALPLLITFFGTRERAEFQAQEQPSLRYSLQAVRHNRPFLFAVGIYLFTWMTIALIEPMLLYFIKYWLVLVQPVAVPVLGSTEPYALIVGLIFIVATAALPLWSWASGRWSKQRAYAGGMAFLAAVLITLAFLPQGTALGPVLVLAALAGIGVSAAHVLPWSIIPDAVEWDELQTGARHEGAFYSLVTLMNKVATSLVLPGALLFLGWSGYVANAPTQGPRVLATLRVLMGGGPALLLLAGIAFALLNPLSRERHLEVRKELEARRAQAPTTRA